MIVLYSFLLDINGIDLFSYFPLSIQSIFLFVITSDVHQPLSQVRLSLVASLGLGQIMFLAGINATQDKVNGCFFLCFVFLLFLFIVFVYCFCFCFLKYNLKQSQ